ncbi:MAG: ABC transporter permease [Dysgonamonadaceae bacterium]|jgi:ABC-type antimicrobial peptide transport system permease subunit|nr:ABC transporter permease [Dysgonamonadaceae bacterium]
MFRNRKGRYTGIFAEQAVVALILMLSSVSIAETVKQYMSPGLLNVENVFLAAFMQQHDVEKEVAENAQQNMNVILDNMKNQPYIEAISRGSNLIPYLRSSGYYEMSSDSIHIDDRHFKTVIKVSDERGAAILKPDIEEGVWLENRALPDGTAPVVVSRQFVEKAGWTSATGKKVMIGRHSVTVVGVVAGLKHEPLIPSSVTVVIPEYLFANHSGLVEFTVKVKKGMKKEFMTSFFKEFRRMNPDKRLEPLAYSIDEMKGSMLSSSIQDIALQAIPTLFLFIIAFIGTFGLSWIFAQKRLREFALRIALGSTTSRLMTIVIGESLLITGIAVIPALLLSYFIYDYTDVHIIGVGVTVLIMLLFSAVSAWYPAWKVSKVNPSEALKYE